MASAAPAVEDREMSVGRVFQRAFSAVGFNPAVILGLALLVGALPSLLTTYALVQSGAMSTASVANGTVSSASYMFIAFLSGILSLVIGSIAQAALTRATVSANEGVRASFGESLGTGLRVFLPLIGLTILFTFGVAIGFVLLFIPGAILLTMWAVAIPALVVERDGIGSAFRRSAELTKGARWKIFGLFLVLLILYWLLSAVLGLVGLRTYAAADAGQGLRIGTVLGTMILGTAFNAFWGTVQPSLYVELRQWKEGGGLENLEQVFA